MLDCLPPQTARRPTVPVLRRILSVFCRGVRVCAVGAVACVLPRPSATGTVPVEAAVQSLRFDGRDSTVPAAKPVTVPHGVRDVQIRFGVPPAHREATRLRYRLVGHDAEWRELPGLMRASVTILDAQGAVLSAANAQIQGASAGWAGTLRHSRFTERALEATLPEGAHLAQLEFVSGGAETTLGVYAFTDIRGDITSANGTHRSFRIAGAGGEGTPASPETPSPWRRSGSRPQMAAAQALPAAPGLAAMLLGDDSTAAYASWRLNPGDLLPVGPGDRLRLNWRECYSIGGGGDGIAEYRFLRPGRYTFEVLATAPDGEFLAPPLQLPLLVRPPLWQEPWTWAVAAALLGCGSWLLSKQLTQTRMQRALAELERQRALEWERSRIAQDIHDDLGANLAQIGMLSELIQSDTPGSHEALTHLDEIFQRAHESGRKLDEIVWAINPVHDTAEELVGYLARFAQEYLRLAQVRFRLDVPSQLGDIPLSGVQRHHLFLAVKEAVHNAVTHAAPQEILLRIRFESHSLSISVADDGRGFTDKPPTLYTRGSAGMLQRMLKINGSFQRVSRPGAGTSVTFQLAVPASL